MVRNIICLIQNFLGKIGLDVVLVNNGHDVDTRVVLVPQVLNQHPRHVFGMLPVWITGDFGHHHVPTLGQHAGVLHVDWVLTHLLSVTGYGANVAGPNCFSIRHRHEFTHEGAVLVLLDIEHFTVAAAAVARLSSVQYLDLNGISIKGKMRVRRCNKEVRVITVGNRHKAKALVVSPERPLNPCTGFSTQRVQTVLIGVNKVVRGKCVQCLQQNVVVTSFKLESTTHRRWGIIYIVVASEKREQFVTHVTDCGHLNTSFI